MKGKMAGGICICIFAAAVLFLAVPFLFNETPAPGAAGGALEKGGGLLPVASSENPLAKYFNKLAKFYGFKKNSPERGSSFKGDVSDQEENLFYMEEGFGAMFGAPGLQEGRARFGGAAVSAEDMEAIRSAYGEMAGVSLSKGTARTDSGLIIKPGESGYYIDDKFYKNGSYPSADKRREIERALAQFHKKKAAEKGLAAAYVKDASGDLYVKYIPPEDLSLLKEALYASSGEDGRPSDYYRGAKIISGGQSYSNGSSLSETPERKNNEWEHLSMDDIDSVYNIIAARIREHFQEDGKEYAAKGEDSLLDESQKANSAVFSHELIENSSRAPINLLISSRLRKDPNKIPDPKYLKAPIVALKLKDSPSGISSLKDLLKKYGVNAKIDFTEIQLPEMNRGVKREEIRSSMRELGQEIQSLKSEDGLVRVFSPIMIPDSVFMKGNGDSDMYVGYPRVPYMDVDKQGQPVITSFSEVFLNRTGLSNMFHAMSGPDGEGVDTAQLEAKYSALDSMREKNSEYLQLLGQNGAINKKMPKIVFYLGKLRGDGGNVAVASPSSFLYVYAPNMAPNFILGGGDSSYKGMPAGDFLNSVNERNSNNIVIVNDEKVRDTLKKVGVKNVSVIQADRLSSGTPEDVEYVIGALKEIISQKIMSDGDLRQEFLKALAASDKKEKERKR